MTTMLLVFKRFLKNFMTKVLFIRGIEAECAKDMAKVGMGKVKSWFNEKQNKN